MKTDEIRLFASPLKQLRAFVPTFFAVILIWMIAVSVSLALDGTPGDDVLVNTGTETNINGLAGDDTITNLGTVSNFINGGPGKDTITNSGTALILLGTENVSANSIGGGNTITNTGTILGIVGSHNQGASSGGGDNIIKNSGLVNDSIYGSLNLGNDSNGGGNTVTNSGSGVRYVVGSLNGMNSTGGGNTVINSGTAISVYGSVNAGPGSIGGGNTVKNSGRVSELVGSFNNGVKSSGGNHFITNSGVVNFIVGSGNMNFNTSSGNNIVTNLGDADVIYGSFNNGVESSGSKNSITNSGFANFIVGSDNNGVDSSGGGNTIINRGTVIVDIYGSNNSGAGSSGGSNFILNSGAVFGSVYGGSGNDTLELVGTAHVGVDIDNFDWLQKTGPGTATVGGNLNRPLSTETAIQGWAGFYPAITAGTATIAGDLRPYGYFPTGTVTLIQTGGLAGGFSSVVDNSPVLDFSVASVGNNVELTTFRRSYASALPGLEGNDLAVANTLSAASHNAHGELAYIIGVLDFMTLPYMESTINQLWPTTLSGLNETGFSNSSLFVDSVMNHLQDLRYGSHAGSGPVFADGGPIYLASAAEVSTPGASRPSPSDSYGLNGFGHMLLSNGDRDRTSEFTGYEYNTAGGILGLDRAFDSDFTGGFYAGYVTSSIDYSDIGDSDGHVDSLNAGVYGSHLFDQWYVDAALFGGYNWYDSERRIVYGTDARTAEADFNGYSLGGHLGAGYDYRPAGWIITPEVAVDYALLHTDSYNEEGAGILNLDVDDITTHFLATTLGVEIAYPFETTADLTVIPSVSAGWKHEFLGNDDDIRTTLSGIPLDPFYIDTAEPDSDAALLGLGLLFIDDSVSVNLRYDARLSSNLDAHRVSGEFRYTF